MHPGAYAAMYAFEEDYWWFRAKREYVRRLIQRHLFIENRDRFLILDCGCGTGRNLIFLSRYGRVIGIDNSDIAIAYCQRNGLGEKVRKADIEHLSCISDEFDLVTALDVLYHRAVRDDVAALRVCYRVLKPGGHLLLTDSAFNFLKSTHDIAVQARERYTLASMENRLRQAGFTVIHMSYTYMATFPLVMMVRMLKKTKSPTQQVESDVKPIAHFLNKFLTVVLGWEAKLAARYRLPVGSSIMMLARK